MLSLVVLGLVVVGSHPRKRVHPKPKPRPQYGAPAPNQVPRPVPLIVPPLQENEPTFEDPGNRYSAYGLLEA